MPGGTRSTPGRAPWFSASRSTIGQWTALYAPYRGPSRHYDEAADPRVRGMGLPHRIDAFAEALRYISDEGERAATKFANSPIPRSSPVPVPA